MTDVVFETLLAALMADPTVGGRVGPSIYKGHISIVPQPAYPCLTLSRARPGTSDPHAPASAWDLWLGCYSLVAYDESWELYEAAKIVLQATHGNVQGRRWIIRSRFEPIEAHEAAERPIYWNTSIFEVRQIG